MKWNEWNEWNHGIMESWNEWNHGMNGITAVFSIIHI